MKTTIKPYTTTFNIRGHKYEITADARFDEHGNVLADKKLDAVASKMALDEFRKDQGYVYPEEIKNFRNKLGFTQKDLANLLGMSPNTIALYELGALPSEANNNLLKLIINNDDNLKQTAENVDVSQRVKDKINKYFNGETVLADNHDLTSPFTAMQLANWLIVKHHLDAKLDPNSEPLSQMKIVKLLYLAYGIFLAQTRNKLFTSEIRHYQYEPLVMEVHEKLKGTATIDGEISNQAYKDFINVSANEDITNLLKYILKKYDRYTASYLCKLTHQDGSPWSKTPDREVINDSLIYESFINGKEI